LGGGPLLRSGLRFSRAGAVERCPRAITNRAKAFDTPLPVEALIQQQTHLIGGLITILDGGKDFVSSADPVQDEN
jgi:hypothetical protein